MVSECHGERTERGETQKIDLPVPSLRVREGK